MNPESKPARGGAAVAHRRHEHRPLQRLTTPLVRDTARRDGGQLRPATWDEALHRAAHGLGSVRDTYGPNAVGIFSCSKSTNEMNYIAQKFLRTVIGCNNIDSCNRT